MKLSQTFLLPVVVTVLTGACLAISGGYFAWVVTFTETDNIFGTALIGLLFWSTLLIPVAAVICGVLPALAKADSEAVLSWVVAALICYLCVGGYDVTVRECGVSYSVLKVKRELLPEEIKSVRQSREICSTAFTYVDKKTRKEVSVFGAEDLIHGTKIWVNEQPL